MGFRNGVVYFDYWYRVGRCTLFLGRHGGTHSYHSFENLQVSLFIELRENAHLFAEIEPSLVSFLQSCSEVRANECSQVYMQLPLLWAPPISSLVCLADQIQFFADCLHSLLYSSILPNSTRLQRYQRWFDVATAAGRTSGSLLLFWIAGPEIWSY